MQTHTLLDANAQGGAADIVIAAMLRVSGDSALRKMGYKIISQIHEEVQHPLPGGLGVAKCTAGSVSADDAVSDRLGSEQKRNRALRP